MLATAMLGPDDSGNAGGRSRLRKACRGDSEEARAIFTANVQHIPGIVFFANLSVEFFEIIAIKHRKLTDSSINERQSK